LLNAHGEIARIIGGRRLNPWRGDRLVHLQRHVAGARHQSALPHDVTAS
jgi:hypothetical protein